MANWITVGPKSSDRCAYKKRGIWTLTHLEGSMMTEADLTSKVIKWVQAAQSWEPLQRTATRWIPSLLDSVNVQLLCWLHHTLSLITLSEFARLASASPCVPQRWPQRGEGSECRLSCLASCSVVFNFKFCICFEIYRKCSGENITAILLHTEACGLKTLQDFRQILSSSLYNSSVN